MIDQQFKFKLQRIRYFLGLFFYSLIAVFREFAIGCKRKFLNQPLFDPTKLHDDLSNCVCLIVGAANGDVGHCSIRRLIASNCNLIITIHGDENEISRTKKNLINNELKNVDQSKYKFEYLDLISLNSIIQLIKKLNENKQKINFLISNAGIACRDLIVTEDGFESQLQINYLGASLFLIGILPLLIQTAKLAKQKNEPKSKIIFTSSCAHNMFKFDLNQVDYVTEDFKSIFSTHKMYPSTKMFQLMFNIEYFNEIIKKNEFDSIITLLNIHPGVMDSGLFDNTFIKQKLYFIYKILSLLMKKPEEGAINVTTPILSKDKFFESNDWLYLEDLKSAKIHGDCSNAKLRKKLFERTITLLKSNIEQFDLPSNLNPLTVLLRSI